MIVGQTRNGKMYQQKFSTDHIMPMTKAQMQRRAERRAQSVRRNHGGRQQWQTLQADNVNAYITGVKAFTEQSTPMNNTIVAEPRFRMYNQDVIQN